MANIKNVPAAVVNVIARASHRPPNSITGAQNLGKPAPIGMDNPTILGMIPALNFIIKQFKPTNFISIPEMSSVGTVSDLIALVLKKCK